MVAKQKSPTDIARDTFKHLAANKIAPTPEAYAKAYHAISGTVVAEVIPALDIKLAQPSLLRILQVGLPSLLQGHPIEQKQALDLAVLVKSAESEQNWNVIQRRVKDLALRLDQLNGKHRGQEALLVKLFQLLLENVGTLLDDDSWLSGQVANIRALLCEPLTEELLVAAMRNLKDVIYKQALLKSNLVDARETVNAMLVTFLDRLDEAATVTKTYHDQLDGYTKMIDEAKNPNEIRDLIARIIAQTKVTQDRTLTMHRDMKAAKVEVETSQRTIAQLEAKLAHMSALALQDELTGSLNRRGLDDMFEREAARAIRKKTKLCVAMLDLDDFKKLNDTYGHQVGDTALVHLVKVIKDTLRTMDIVARFGGEEFVVLLPDTDVETASQTIVRLQRELTNRIFMHDDQRLFITFSAGVTLVQPEESLDNALARADSALYDAKRQGKHRVVVK